MVVRAAEDTAQAANLVVGFRALIGNPHMRIGSFHGFIVHQKSASKKPNSINGVRAMRRSASIGMQPGIGPAPNSPPNFAADLYLESIGHYLDVRKDEHLTSCSHTTANIEEAQQGARR